MTEIEEAELKLKNLGLGVRASVPMSEPGMRLVFAKEEKLWRLLIEYKTSDDEEGSLAPLDTAKYEYQQEGLSLLPELSEALLVAAETLIARMTEAVATIRPWLDSFPAPQPKPRKNKR
jgi:hypothetical protein